jgi:hypothetical protein
MFHAEPDGRRDAAVALMTADRLTLTLADVRRVLEQSRTAACARTTNLAHR